MGLDIVVNAIASAGLPIGLLIALVAFMYLYFKAEKDKDVKNQKFVDRVLKDSKTREDELRKESKYREESLFKQLDKYNNSLDNNNKILDKISQKITVIDVIPKLQEDINEIKIVLNINQSSQTHN